MIRRLVTAVFVALVAIGSNGFAAGDGITKRVRFTKGKTSITLRNSVVRGDRDTYILSARTGQKLSVRITSAENNAVFQIEEPNGTSLDGAGELDDATSFSAALPRNGEYRVVVGGTRGNASYRLTISIR